MKLYFIYAGTGCTCCNDQNHYRGPYESAEDARRRIDYYKSENSKFWPLASQYANRGRYSVSEYEIEEIGKDRWIIEDRVFPATANISVNEDGSVDNDNDEYFSDNL